MSIRRSYKVHDRSQTAQGALPDRGDTPPQIGRSRAQFPLRSRYVLVGMVLCVGLALSIALFVIARKWEDERARGMFDDDVAAIASRLERSLASDREVLDSIGRFYAASIHVDRKEFGTFVAGALSRYPHFQALEWVPFVPASERTIYEEAARADGYLDFQLTEKDALGNLRRVSERPEYFPVYYVEPFVGNEIALGYDLGSEPDRLEALERARDTGTFVATERITLVQETGEQFGFLVFLPIYRNGAPLGALEERRAALTGFALAVFRIGDFIERPLGGLDTSPYAICLYDPGAPAEQQLLYESPHGAQGTSSREHVESGLHKTVGFMVGGRPWSLLIHPKSGYLPDAQTPLAPGSLIGGLLMTLALASYLALALKQAGELSRTNAKLQGEIVERQQAEAALQESERRYREFADMLPQPVFEADEQGRTTFANKAALESFGYAQEDVDARLEISLGTALADRARAEEDIRRVLRGQPVSGQEYEAVAKDGNTFSVAVYASPIVRHGRIAGIRGIVVDITDRKRAEETLQQSFDALEQTLEDTVQAMALTVEMRDPYTAGHQQRVAVLAGAIATDMGLPDQQIQVIRLAATIHDIGKISVPAEILSKPGRLSEMELELVKAHSESSYDILKRIAFPWPIAEIVRQHHERMDGSGYPMGLRGQDILPEARILAVADVVEAMSSHRPYRPALGMEAALQEIALRSGTAYDAHVVNACCKLLTEKEFCWAPERRMKAAIHNPPASMV